MSETSSPKEALEQSKERLAAAFTRLEDLIELRLSSQADNLHTTALEEELDAQKTETAKFKKALTTRSEQYQTLTDSIEDINTRLEEAISELEHYVSADHATC